MEELAQPPAPVTEKQKIALAEMWANPDMRSYLVHAIQTANQNALTALKGKNAALANDYSMRAQALELLLNLSKHWYMHFDKIRKKALSTEISGVA